MKKLICLLIVGLLALAISCKTATERGISKEQQVRAANAASGGNN